MRHCPCANKQKRGHFHAKTTSAKLYIYIGVGSRDLIIDEAHTALGIFPVFSPCMLPTPLCGIFCFVVFVFVVVVVVSVSICYHLTLSPMGGGLRRPPPLRIFA